MLGEWVVSAIGAVAMSSWRSALRASSGAIWLASSAAASESRG